MTEKILPEKDDFIAAVHAYNEYKKTKDEQLFAQKVNAILYEPFKKIASILTPEEIHIMESDLKELDLVDAGMFVCLGAISNKLPGVDFELTYYLSAHADPDIPVYLLKIIPLS